jgi:predicted nucleic acid-binding protein
MSTIYLDVCCYNRPFNDYRQPRIRLEGGAVVSILEMVREGAITLVGSEMVTLEVNHIPKLRRRRRIQRLIGEATLTVQVGATERARGKELEAVGFSAPDALHLACAEAGKADVLLTTDDRFLQRAQRYASMLHVRVENPVNWIQEVKPR